MSRMERFGRGRTIGLAAAVLLLGAAALVRPSFASLTAKTTNPGNAFSTGTVVLTDNDSNGVLVPLTSATGGDSVTSCIQVTMTGSVGSAVHLYGTVTGTLGPYLTLTVTRGTQASPSFSSCTGFTADAVNYIGSGNGVIYSGNLSAFPTTYAAGIVDPSTGGGTETWTSNEAHIYQFQLTMQSNTAAQGQTSTSTFTWEAQQL